LATNTDLEEGALSLEEFVKLPTTVAFNAINTKRFQVFVKNNPYIKTGTQLGTGYVPVYLNIKNIPILFEELGNNYLLFPAILSPVDAQANTEAGITPILEHPYLELSGKGVIIGVVDTGIDYTKDVFQYEDGTSKIISIWDQTIDGARSSKTYFGSEYSREQINEALKAEDPFEVVPSRDMDGHGTFLASVAAGRQTKDYIGAAPGAELIVVKLKRAHEYFIKELFLPPDKPNYFHNADVMLGMQYIIEMSRERNAPLVICNGLGSNDAGHDGYTMFGEYISYISQRAGFAVVTAAGNESNAKHHTQGVLFRTGSTDVIGIRVGEASASFSFNIFAAAYDKFSVGITSPSGEVISRVPFNVDVKTKEELIFEKTIVYITYYKAVNTVVTISFQDAREGIWEINLYGDSILGGEYHAWLPITYQVSPEVQFMKPVPEYTIVYPGNALRSIVCGAYNPNNNSLYVSSSWGPTRLPRMAPDFVAPGVNVAGVYPTGFGTMTGTSVAAAVAAGAAAILMEWGIVKGNYLSMDGDVVRLLLISGCKRDEEIEYPNVKWGYGKLDLYATFWGIRESNIRFNTSEEVL
jgi:subtilisin family serine protease